MDFTDDFVFSHADFPEIWHTCWTCEIYLDLPHFRFLSEILSFEKLHDVIENTNYIFTNSNYLKIKRSITNLKLVFQLHVFGPQDCLYEL